ncbi:MAG: ComEC/Rec2 family competence protein [Patescibacteria group bacterium]
MPAGLYSFIGAFVFGVFFRSFINLGVEFSFFLILLSVFLFLYYLFLKKRLEKTYSILLLISLTLFAFSVGILRFHIAEKARSYNLNAFLSHRVEIKGRVVKEPDNRDTSSRIVFSPNTINGIEVSGLISKNNKILLTVPSYPKVYYGDLITIAGVFEKPQSFLSESGIVFDYPSYLAKENILYQIKNAEIVSVIANKNFSFLRILFSAKEKFIEGLHKNLPEPHSSLASGVLLGGEDPLPKDVQDKFRKTGIIHIVVLSGYNVSLVVLVVMFLAAFFLPRTFAYLLTSIFIVVFVLFVGAGASTIRAALMAILVLYGRFSYRKVNILRLLSVAACIMVFHNPYIVAFDPSFQLSFLATLGLIVFSEYIGKFIPKFFPLPLKEILAATIATQIFVLPLILYRSGEFPLMTLPVNLLVLPLIPVVMFFAFLTAIGALFSSFIALPFSLLTTFFISYIFSVVNIFSSLPFSTFPFHISFYVVVFLYFSYAIILFFLNKKPLRLKAERE